MKRFIFVTGTMKGIYSSVNSQCEPAEHRDVSLYLGVARGLTVNEAWGSLYERHGLRYNIPDINKVIGFELADDGTFVTTDAIKIDKEYAANKEPIKLDKYEEKQCKYCKDKVPSNGAAQFAHLKKHINALLSKGALTKEQATSIRSIKLTPEIDKIFMEQFGAHK